MQVLGIDGAVRFLLAFGGAELIISKKPYETNELVRMFGREAVEALANLTTVPRRIPLAKPWLAVYFHSQGLSVAQIARKLRIADIAVRNYLRRNAENRERLRGGYRAHTAITAAQTQPNVIGYS
ncbi:MAG: helix-turn-helix domain-containing protein [Paracoccus sp. (in: a-proteobacteria)]